MAARDAPTAAPSESAKASTAAKSPLVPRPPETTIFASVSSGRPPLATGSSAVTVARVVDDVGEVEIFSTDPAVPLSASTELERSVTIEVP
ncbi:unannotated protein [freshwater metagenome]|uniref:Unannotated protein n=1 Tax=freshwater metagenome TaxID=449393 RepID=A0A6J6HW43_9ZZZZ